MSYTRKETMPLINFHRHNRYRHSYNANDRHELGELVDKLIAQAAALVNVDPDGARQYLETAEKYLNRIENQKP